MTLKTNSPHQTGRMYSLVLAAVPYKDYASGWLAGSIPAHLIVCEQHGKVFWFCPVQFGRGPKETERERFNEMMNKILDGRTKIAHSYKGITLSKYGFF